jgi:3-methyladenine DNA glycosylase AlkD
MKHAAFLQEVETRLIDAAQGISPDDAEKLRRYHGSTVPHLGLAVPVQRQMLRLGYSFSRLPFEQQLPVWDALWRQARYYEAKTQALYYSAARRKPAELAQLWSVVHGWIETVDCWDSSDELSSIYARILEVEGLREEVYAVLCRWNRSTNPWKRRQSILSLLYYSRSRRSVLPSTRIFPLIESLIEDDDRFVQKAVGWSLREALTPFPDETEAFIRRHVKTLSPTAFTEATRKLPPDLRQQIKAARRPSGRNGKIRQSRRSPV